MVDHFVEVNKTVEMPIKPTKNKENFGFVEVNKTVEMPIKPTKIKRILVFLRSGKPKQSQYYCCKVHPPLSFRPKRRNLPEGDAVYYERINILTAPALLIITKRLALILHFCVQ